MAIHAAHSRHSADGSADIGSGVRRTVMGIVSGITAAAAWYGSGYLAFGSADTGMGAAPSILPGGDWVFGGIALALIVAVPMTATTVLLALGRDIGVDAAVGSAALLIIWLAVQMLILGLANWLQPAYLAVGVLVFALGIVELRRQGSA